MGFELKDFGVMEVSIEMRGICVEGVFEVLVWTV